MTRSSDDRSRFLQILADTPFLFHACKKAGISRAAVYRWMKSNPEFKKAVHKMLDEGRINMTEIGEIALMKKVQQGETGAIRFLLMHNSERYMARRPLAPAYEITQEEREMFRQIYEWFLRNQGLPRAQLKSIINAMTKWGFYDEDGQVTEHFKKTFPKITEYVKTQKKDDEDT